ncbi:MAG: alpha/beta hydrolase [Planctomycetota bacterium]|jgi:pimeloyl-ACP methyl ester carboxylesterase
MSDDRAPEENATEHHAEGIPIQFRAMTILTIFLSGSLFGIGLLHRAGIFPGPPTDSVTHRNNAKPVENAVFVKSADGTKVRTTYNSHTGIGKPLHFLYCGGNAEASGHPGSQPIKTLCTHGDVLTFDYRNFGDTVGRPSEAGLYQDARAVYMYGLNELGWKPGRVVIYGRSLGGAPAIRLATDLLADERMEMLKDGQRPAGLILEAPFTNIPHMGAVVHPWLPKPEWISILHLNNLKRAPELALPVLHFHGDEDEIIPFSLGEELHGAIPPGSKQFLILAGTGHLNVWEKNRALLTSAIGQFSRRCHERDRN